MNQVSSNGDYLLNHRYPLTIMKYTQLIRLLVARELTLRYKRSVIGIGWTLLNPVLTSAVLWYVFSFVFASRLPSGQQFAPYLMAGILLNTFFNQSLTQSADSIASNGGVLTKIYVPPQIFAISAVKIFIINNKLLINSLKIVKNLFLKQEMAIYSFCNTNELSGQYQRPSFHSEDTLSRTLYSSLDTHQIQEARWFL